MTSAKQTLLTKIIEHVAAEGLSDASLRELAAAVGSSHRMLIYHFGSREGLVAAIVGSIEEQQRQALADIAEHASTAADIILRQWAQLSAPELLPFVRLFYEVVAQASYGRAGTEGFLDRLTEPWLEVAADISRRLGFPVDRDELRLGVAVMRGLLIEVLASGDPAPATASLQLFMRMLERSRADAPDGENLGRNREFVE